MLKCICGASETVPFGEKNGGKVATCVNCGLVRRVEYDPAAIEQLYTEGTYYHDQLQKEVGHEPYSDRYWHDYSVAAMRFPQLLREYRLLDVGCANGAFIAYARAQGMRASGLELNERMAQEAHERSGCPVHTSWTTVRGEFDVITYLDVIEHVPDPQAEIDRAASFLAPGGILVLDTPDADHEDFKRLGLAWHHMRPEQHIHYFREQDLRRLVNLAGLDVTCVSRPIPGKVVAYCRRAGL